MTENGSSSIPKPNIIHNKILRKNGSYSILTSILRNSRRSRQILNLKNRC